MDKNLNFAAVLAVIVVIAVDLFFWNLSITKPSETELLTGIINGISGVLIYWVMIVTIKRKQVKNILGICDMCI